MVLSLRRRPSIRTATVNSVAAIGNYHLLALLVAEFTSVARANIIFVAATFFGIGGFRRRVAFAIWANRAAAHTENHSLPNAFSDFAITYAIFAAFDRAGFPRTGDPNASTIGFGAAAFGVEFLLWVAGRVGDSLEKSALPNHAKYGANLG